jgi:hypothetical protein
MGSVLYACWILPDCAVATGYYTATCHYTDLLVAQSIQALPPGLIELHLCVEWFHTALLRAFAAAVDCKPYPANLAQLDFAVEDMQMRIQCTAGNVLKL